MPIMGDTDGFLQLGVGISRISDDTDDFRWLSI